MLDSSVCMHFRIQIWSQCTHFLSQCMHCKFECLIPQDLALGITIMELWNNASLLITINSFRLWSYRIKDVDCMLCFTQNRPQGRSVCVHSILNAYYKHPVYNNYYMYCPWIPQLPPQRFPLIHVATKYIRSQGNNRVHLNYSGSIYQLTNWVDINKWSVDKEHQCNRLLRSTLCYQQIGPFKKPQ